MRHIVLSQTLSNTEFKDILQAESEVRPDMSYTEWADLCRKAGVAHTDDEVASLLRSYSDAGVVLHFQERVYLQPKEIAESILSVRPPADSPVDTPVPHRTSGTTRRLSGIRRQQRGEARRAAAGAGGSQGSGHHASTKVRV